MEANDFSIEPMIRICPSTKGSSGRFNTGLTIKETEVLFEQILGISATHPDFLKNVNKWYIESSVKATTAGTPLEIGMEVDNDSAVIYKNAEGETVRNFPLDIEDYVKYKYLQNNPTVAQSAEKANNNTIKAYFRDPYLEIREVERVTKLKNEASAKYLAIANDADKVAMYLTMAGVDIRFEKGSLIARLKDFVDKNPEQFLAIVADKDGEHKNFLLELKNYEIVKVVGTAYMTAENDTLGYSFEDTIQYLKNKANAEQVKLLKARLAQLKK